MGLKCRQWIESRRQGYQLPACPASECSAHHPTPPRLPHTHSSPPLLLAVHCIVHWASLREDHALCPQCKVPFSEVISYRNLDGSLQDFPVQNPVCLMRRAGWFQSIAGQHAEDGRLPEPEGSWGDDFAEAFDEDEELEDYYFSSAAGRARIVFGNRRFGEGGYIASGRRQARAAAEAAPRKRVGKRGKATVAPPEQAAARGQASASIPISRKQREQSVPGAQGQSPPLGSSPAGSGRRATRNARRSAVDSY